MHTVVDNRASDITFNILMSNNLNENHYLLPANICPIVPATLLKAKKTFEFIDINATNYLINYEKVLKVIKTRNDIGGIIVSNSLGADANHEPFFKHIKSYKEDILIVNDKCLNSPDPNIPVTLADVTLFSTGYSKIIDLGKGGFAHLSDKVNYKKQELSFSLEDRKKLVKQFNYSLKTKQPFSLTTFNWLGDPGKQVVNPEYFDTIQKQLILMKIHKSKLNRIYFENINPEFQLGKEFNNWRFSLKINNKDVVLNKIFEQGLFASSHYQPLVPMFGNGNSENATYLHERTVNLFNDFRYDETQAYETAILVNKYAQ